MAIVRAVKSGNWSDTTVWNTGALPTSADDVYSNTFTVTIDQSVTVLRISNGSATGVTGGGTFQASLNGITITANGTGFITHTSGNVILLTASPAAGSTISLVGTVNTSISANSGSQVVVFSGAGTLNITGSIVAQSGYSPNSATVLVSGAGTLNLTGDVTAPPNTNLNNSAPAIQITNANSTVNVTGNVTGSTATYNQSTISSGIEINAASVLTVTGSVTANGTSGIYSATTPTVTHIGTVTAANARPGISVAGGTVSLTGPFLTSANGTHPVYCPIWRWHTSIPTSYYQIRTQNTGTIRPLYTGDSVGGNPATNNVRSGTIYGPSNELTGTCAVPAAGSVALGVAVDNTTGTAILTQQNVQDALTAASAVTLNQQTSSLTTAGSIGERLKLASTVATTAQQLSDALSNE